jgi:hypothetical protein
VEGSETTVTTSRPVLRRGRHGNVGYSTAFVVGPAALMPRKGGLERRRWGRPYVGGMIVN